MNSKSKSKNYKIICKNLFHRADNIFYYECGYIHIKFCLSIANFQRINVKNFISLIKKHNIKSFIFMLMTYFQFVV